MKIDCRCTSVAGSTRSGTLGLMILGVFLFACGNGAETTRVEELGVVEDSLVLPPKIPIQPPPAPAPDPAQRDGRNWEDLVSFRPSEAVQDAFYRRPYGHWTDFQPIEEGLYDTNLDEFAVQIEALPIDPATGRRFHPLELLNYVRLNLNQFTQPHSRFYPYENTPEDTQRWESSNPVGSVVSIDVVQFAGIPIDTVGVLTSEYSVTDPHHFYWIFTTISTPSDVHPLSGHRQFGIRLNEQSETWTFYARAADRPSPTLYLIDPLAVYRGGQATWRALQENLASFINDEGGSATALPVHYQSVAWADVCESSWYPTEPWVKAAPEVSPRNHRRCQGPHGGFVPAANAPFYQGGIQVQNIGDEEAEFIQLVYQDQNARIVGTDEIALLAPGAAETFVDSIPKNQTVSARVRESDQPVQLVTNLVDPERRLFSSTTGFVAGSSFVYLPLVMRDSYGFDTWFAIQNTFWHSVDVTITYYDERGTIVHRDQRPIPEGSSIVYHQGQDPDLPRGFSGSVVVDASGSVAVTVYQESETEMMSYNGLSPLEAGEVLWAPLVPANNYGFNSGIRILNVGASETQVTVTYGENVAEPSPGGLPPCRWSGSAMPRQSASADVKPGESYTVLQGGSATGRQLQFDDCSYVGTAKITAGQPIVAVINQRGDPTQGARGASSETALNERLLAHTLNVPLLQARNYRVTSGLSVLNAATPEIRVELIYGPNRAGGQNREGFPACTERSSGKEIADPFGFVVSGQKNYVVAQAEDFAQDCSYLGSASLSSTANVAKLAGIVNQLISEPDFVDPLGTYGVSR